MNLWDEQDARKLPGNLEFLRRALRREVTLCPDFGEPGYPEDDGDEFLEVGGDYLVQFCTNPVITKGKTGFWLIAYRPSQRYRYDEPPEVDEIELGFIARGTWASDLARTILMWEAKEQIESRLSDLGETMNAERFDNLAAHRHCAGRCRYLGILKREQCPCDCHVEVVYAY